MRSEERSRDALAQIRDNIVLARDFAAGLDARGLAADTRTFYAVVRCLEIISEASRRLSPAVKERHRHLPWAQIASAGNVYRHAYQDVNPEAVAKVVADSLPVLLTAIEAELSRPA